MSSRHELQEAKPWRGSRGKILTKESKRAGSVHAPGPCYFNKEQTPLAISLDTNPRFHGGSFGVLGTPLIKALKL
jgi:hypothetical protein